ncbi:beta galactosidase jelly roll domain-containing protein [Echinicola sp. CAU 1574]|uniref:Beta galactosidase jelly roll domain-containing protein n=1 Tax=Echinicola arenosa TaxID=2774144 RepID=A0ABR9AJI8_9BACT|nr:sialate O-acetylesterase [Echinicola arenosa]MBD8488013.1 beta galactosidase jelly roll domain-containing protein [Echinicola arenosa]
MYLSKQFLKSLVLLIFVWIKASQLHAEVRLPHLISEGMVLQWGETIRIWGWGMPGEQVDVKFFGEEKQTKTNEKGLWEVVFDGMEAGGPYKMLIKGVDNSFQFNEVWLGDVWLCSGQSNMEQTMSRVEPMFPEEIQQANNPMIRYFDVPDAYDFSEPQQDVKGGKWLSANKANIYQFSAVAYFFAKKIQEDYDIPIGLINASVGGSPIQSWIREAELKRFPEDYDEAMRFKNPDLIKKIEKDDRERMTNWYKELNQKDKAYQSQTGNWNQVDFEPLGWTKMEQLDFWPEPMHGVFWFRKTFELDESLENEANAKLLLGTIVDADSVFINGNFVGNTTYRYPPRRYEVPRGVLKPGKNVIMVRVINERDRGGFVRDKPYELVLGEKVIPLQEDWEYHLGAEMPELQGQTFIRWNPLGLYQAMVAPIHHFPVKGILWYQGESNTGRPDLYVAQMEALIQGWRAAWKRDDLPFLFVQLPNFMASSEQPQESNWAKLREAQRKSLSIPHTGMAVTIDVGEANDIHPLDKKNVGNRLALQAKKVAYGEDEGVFSGPMIQSVEKKGAFLELTFAEVGEGLLTSDGNSLAGFAVAGEDGVFVWTKAQIVGKKVMVKCEAIDNPQKIRYAWANNPVQANLMNQQGLPASPFEMTLE